MNIYEPERRVLRILAALKGGYLHLEMYDEKVGARLESTNFPLSQSDLWKLAKALEEKGLVASILERLDGLLIALTATGRAVMVSEGATFDAAVVANTRKLFEGGLCKAEM